MSALLLAAAAAGFAPPAFTPDALRQLEQSAGSSVSAEIDAQVDPKGRISNCKAIPASGNAGGLCSLAEKVRIEPASVLGQSAYGVVRQAVRPAGAATALREPSDIEVQVNVLPASRTSLRVEANVLVAASGKPQACNAGDAPPGYGDVACGQVSAVTFGILKDSDGKPVQYVRTVAVDFVSSAG
jgi:hypothetical protein